VGRKITLRIFLEPTSKKGVVFMGDDAISTTSEQVFAQLQAELGKRQILRSAGDPKAPIAYLHPGAERPVLIFFHDEPLGPILRIEALVSEKADWVSPGLAEMLLREQSAWMFGRAERRGEGLVVEHCLGADTVPDWLATVVVLLAATALDLRHDLGRMGVLTIVEEAA